MNFADHLRSERRRLNLSQTQTEALLGLGKGVITAWETHRNIPHPWIQDTCVCKLRAQRPAGAPPLPTEGAKP